MTGRRTSYSKFTAEEDEILREAFRRIGENDWRGIARELPGRTVRQVKDRWMTYLSDGVRSGPWSREEDQQLIALHREMGAKWVQIAGQLRGRTDVMVKNRYNQIVRRMKRDVEVVHELMSMDPTALLSMALAIETAKSMSLESVSVMDMMPPVVPIHVLDYPGAAGCVHGAASWRYV
jgi:hypothetical protein